jgi:hypothetical protein
MRWLDQLFCGLVTGHTYIPCRVWVPEKHRHAIKWVCESCVKQKDGWIIDGKGPRKRFDGDDARHQIRRVQ